MTGGLQWQDFSSTLESPDSAIPLSESAAADLPVPLLGFSYRHLLTRRTRFLLTATVLPEVHIGDIASGSFTSLFAAVEAQLLRNVGLGVSYSLGDLSVEIEKNAFQGELDYVTEGFQAYARILF